jgi:hypothetical protein
MSARAEPDASPFDNIAGEEWSRVRLSRTAIGLKNWLFSGIDLVGATHARA